MQKTFEDILQYLQSEKGQPNHYQAKRSSRYSIPDLLARGAEVLDKEAGASYDGLSDDRGGGMDGDEESAEPLTAQDLSADGAI